MRRWIALFTLGLTCPVAHAADLEARIAAFAEHKPSAFGNSGIHVVDASTGESIYALNEHEFFLPASNAKLFTAALALEKLGADYRFTTKVLAAPSGDLVLVGSGDPSMSGRVYPYIREPRDKKDAPRADPIDELAAQIVKRGILRIDGDIVGNDSLFPWVPYPQTWSVDDTSKEYGAPVSALSVDDNVVAFLIAPAARAGEHASFSLSRQVEFLTIDHRVITGPRGSSPSIQLRHVPGSRQWIVTGSIPLGHATVVEELPVDDPAAFAAVALYDALVRRGVAIRGRPVAHHRPQGTSYVAPTGSEVASRQSPPLTELLRMMEKVSQNLHAELLLREVGRVRRQEGSTEAGLAELEAFLKSIDVPAEQSAAKQLDVRMDDGSGLGRNTLVTPRWITQLLTHEYASENRDLWISLLPAGGEDGTLEHRLCCVSDGGGIHAKTGSLSRAVALSGYALTKTSGTLAFSILVNDFAAPNAEVRAWVDKIAAALLE